MSRLINTNEAALKIGISPERLREWVRRKENDVPYYTVGEAESRLLFPVDELDKWIESNIGETRMKAHIHIAVPDYTNRDLLSDAIEVALKSQQLQVKNLGKKAEIDQDEFQEHRMKNDVIITTGSSRYKKSRRG